MPDAIQFTGSSPRFGLPFLFPSQAQKEFFVNEAHVLADILLHTNIEGEGTNPPAQPESGQAWLVAGAASGEWAGKESQIAAFQAGTWVYVEPVIGMRIFNKADGQFMHFNGGWNIPTAPIEALGGQTVDTELRAAFVGLVESLKIAGIYSAIE